MNQTQVEHLRGTIPHLKEIDRLVYTGDLLFCSKEEEKICIISDEDYDEYRCGGNRQQAARNKFNKEKTATYPGYDVPENFYQIANIQTENKDIISVLLFRDNTGLFMKPILDGEKYEIHVLLKKWGFNEYCKKEWENGVMCFVSEEQQAKWEIRLAQHKIATIRERVKIKQPKQQPHRAFINAVHNLCINKGEF